ncbi:MAG TPA: serine/threonine protein kinase [Anaerolineales bacterium]|nr:serine/threonine protein kinase [Anaerolineales bacterium]
MQDPLIGKISANRYRIDSLMGSGGMASVYKAWDPNLERFVAIKVIHRHLSNNSEFARRFREEATAVARLRHEHIVQVFDFNNDEGLYFIVFEFLPGETVQNRLARLNEQGRFMPIELIISIAREMAEALDYAHNQNMIHRDIKPGNIMLDMRNQAVLMDFGIAKISDSTLHTATGAVVGTARYMSPEQVRGDKLDTRSDFYSLGVTLYEMASGRPPFEADSAMTLMVMHVNDPVPNLHNLRADVPIDLKNIIHRLLSKYPTGRYANGAELSAALGKVRMDVFADDPTMGAVAVGKAQTKYTPKPPSEKNARPSTQANEPVEEKPAKKFPWWIALVLIGLLAVVGIFWAMGGAAMFAPPTATPTQTANPTATATPQPTTAVPPTDTPLPPTATTVPSPSATTQATPNDTPTQQASETPSPTPDTRILAKVNIDKSALRGGPGTDYELVGNLRLNDEVSVIGRNAQGTWFNVETSSGKLGWISKPLLTFNDANAISQVSLAATIPARRATATFTKSPTPLATNTAAATPTNPPCPAEWSGCGGAPYITCGAIQVGHCVNGVWACIDDNTKCGGGPNTDTDALCKEFGASASDYAGNIYYGTGTTRAGAAAAASAACSAAGKTCDSPSTWCNK